MGAAKEKSSMPGSRIHFMMRALLLIGSGIALLVIGSTQLISDEIGRASRGIILVTAGGLMLLLTLLGMRRQGNSGISSKVSKKSQRENEAEFDRKLKNTQDEITGYRW